MRQILILGGTNFIGRNLIEKLKTIPAYQLTLFNRQQTAPTMFPDIKTIKGDRATNDISLLKNQYWDCVIDLSCYYPHHLKDLLDILEGKFSRYIFISTISVYQLTDQLITENTPTLPGTNQDYGNHKAACEHLLLNNLHIDKIILRPSIVYSKYDYTDRFYYWLYKAKHQRPVMVPGDLTHKITLTYVQDLVNIIHQSIELLTHRTIYNASTHAPLTLKSLVHTIDRNLPTINIPADQLIQQGVLPEESIPLWFDMPLMISNEKLCADYNELIPFEKSVHETIAYYESLGWPRPKTDKV